MIPIHFFHQNAFQEVLIGLDGRINRSKMDRCFELALFLVERNLVVLHLAIFGAGFFDISFETVKFEIIFRESRRHIKLDKYTTSGVELHDVIEGFELDIVLFVGAATAYTTLILVRLIENLKVLRVIKALF